ncbi:MAG: hypothetical protein ACUVWV_06895 [Thermodesulfobacteriota bacterium]
MATLKIENFGEELPKLLPAELKEKLMFILEEIKNYGIGQILIAYPDFFARLFKQIKKSGSAELLRQNPKASDLLSDLLWEGLAGQVEKRRESQIVLQKADRKMRINIEAYDSPFKNHFIVQEGKISGSSGLLHFKDEDFRFMGPTEVLIDLLLGDLSLGFSNLRLQTAGHSGWFSRIGPIMREINKIIKGSQEETKIQF